MEWYYFVMVTGGSAIVLGTVVYTVLYRRKTQRAMQQVLDKLDQALVGESVDVQYDESMDAAISQRLNRVIQSADMQKHQAQGERDSVKSLVSDISHQVRTPLSNIMLYSGLLEEKELDIPTKKLVEKIQIQSEKLEFFMKELVKSSRTEQEMIRVFPEKIMLSDLIHQACQMVEVDALKKNMRIRYEEKNCVCFADAKWTVEAIGNILDNAIKYAPEGSDIEIEEITYDSFIGLTIKDDGIGIEEQEQGLIFQRFHRCAEVSNTPGFGIGLYLVREVLSKQGGYVKVTSSVGKGATFQLFFARNNV